ncbi:MAG: hypothetical protein Q27BPR15_05445 [Rhodobacter sp. CACIA14H1]|nr:MAG: hypothetical protein Q27BPR15_05445 [Rhodobacter sp. CACIA14H1]
MRSVQSRLRTSRDTSVSSIRALVVCQPKGMTSTGSGKAPSWVTSFAASAMTIIWSDAVATIFSCRSAAPPPLISARLGSNSSAPSMVRSSHFTSSSDATGTPSDAASSAVRVEVGTPVTRSPSSRMRSARQRTIHAAVEPVPRPSFIPSSTNSVARLAATNFALSMGDRSAGMGQLHQVLPRL